MSLAWVIEMIRNFFRKTINIRPKSLAWSEWSGGAQYHLRFRVRRFGKWIDKAYDYDCQNDDEGCKTARNILQQHGIREIADSFSKTPSPILDLYEIELTHGVPYVCVDQD